jgi:segregation and condensation protein A
VVAHGRANPTALPAMLASAASVGRLPRTNNPERPPDALAAVCVRPHNPAMRFRVQLDTFAGPLDLLLYLVRKHELDVLEIPIARVAEQYLELITVIEQIDVDAVGDFLDLATRLMELKARMMLPRQDEAEEQEIEESRQDLVAKLLEYKKYKDAAVALEERNRQWQLRFARRTNDLDDGSRDPADQPIHEVELWDLVSAFSRVMREKAAPKPTRIRHDETPIETHMQRIAERLAAEPRIHFADLFPVDGHKSQLVGLFLALLELIRHHRARVEQTELFGEIWILAPATLAVVGAVVSEHPSA